MSEHKGWHSRGYLPHFDSPETIQQLVFRTVGSLPVAIFAALPEDVQQRRREIDSQLDAGLWGRALSNSASAAIVESVMLHSDGAKFHLLAWCVMPNHVHAVIEQLDGSRLGEIVKAWKGASARLLNDLNGTQGSFWAPDFHDRFIRDEKHLAQTLDYVESNPVRAKLVAVASDWPFSSASARERGCPHPLVRPETQAARRATVVPVERAGADARGSGVRLSVVAAVARNGVIGGDNRLLWNLSSDLKRFRALTTGKPMIMGRRTFASIGKPLPGRETVVVTRDRGFAAPGVHVAHSIPEALALAAERARAMGAQEMVLAGGGELYAALIGAADRLHITQVDLAPEGDAHFPAIDPALWRETGRQSPPRGPRDEADFTFVDYERLEPVRNIAT